MPDNALPEGAHIGISVLGVNVVLARVETRLFALLDQCSHDVASLSDGHLYGAEIMCPRHGARFDLRTGQPRCPPAYLAVATFPVRVHKGNIQVFIREADTAPT